MGIIPGLIPEDSAPTYYSGGPSTGGGPPTYSGPPTCSGPPTYSGPSTGAVGSSSSEPSTSGGPLTDIDLGLDQYHFVAESSSANLMHLDFEFAAAARDDQFPVLPSGARPAHDPALLSQALAMPAHDPVLLSQALQTLNMTQFSRSTFLRLFGPPTPSEPFGNNLWMGMRGLLRDLCRRGGRGSPAGYTGFQAGWFHPPPPQHWSAANAALPIGAHGAVTGTPYPCVFIVESTEHVLMWCQHILAYGPKRWRVHLSRITILEDSFAFINYQLEGTTWHRAC